MYDVISVVLVCVVEGMCVLLVLYGLHAPPKIDRVFDRAVYRGCIELGVLVYTSSVSPQN